MKSRITNEPISARWILSLLSKYNEEFVSCGDMGEEYKEIADERGSFIAHLWYWVQVLYAVPSYFKHEIKWRFIMFQNYMKIALRNFKKYKSYTFINISGLAIGMAVCMLIMLWVQDELNFDKFNKNLDDIFCVVHYSPNDTNNNSYSIPAPVTPFLKDNYAEIEYASRYRGNIRLLFSFNGKNVFKNYGGFADPGLFDIFSFKAVIDNPKDALLDINTIILTESMAESIFGSENPVGRTVKLENQYDFFVGAVIEDIPENSYIQFDYLIPFENFGRFYQIYMDNWGTYYNYQGFVILHDNVDYRAFSDKIADEITNHNPNAINKLRLFPYKDIRLFGFNNNGTLKFVLVFSAIGILILLIACINFINLATAMSGKRSKEISMRKVIGAGRSLIRRQIYSELFVLVTIAFILAVILSYVLLPKINVLSGKALSFSIIKNSGLLLGMLGIAMFTAIISGTYPAFYLSSFSPLRVIKSTVSTGSSTSPFRKLLVISQFTVSTILIISTIIITSQIRYIKNKELGFDKDHLIFIALQGELKSRFDTVKNELLRNPDINGVTTASSLPNNASNSAGDLDWEGKPANVRGAMNFISVEKDYFKTVGIDFIEGETFKSIPDDEILREFIINQKAFDLMQIENPVGKSFRMWDRAPGRIIGIVKNVHNVSLHREIRPVFYTQFPYFYDDLLININNENVDHTIDFIRNVVTEINPDYPFEFHFLDENIDGFYQTEIQTNSIITYFTVLAVLISCLGLFGLSLFMAEQRVKEIGIRKTLGATVSNIVGLMSKGFFLLVAFSNLVSWPVAYYIMNKWLQNYAYRVNFTIWIFALSGLAALVIALLSVSYQSIKAARANPVDSLRYE